MLQKKLSGYVFCYRILSRCYFYLPLLTLFFTENGFKYNEIILILLSYSIFCLLFTFFKRENINVKKSLIVNEIVKTLGLLLIVFSSNIVTIIIAQFLLAYNYSCSLGLDTKIINTLIDEEHRTELQKKSNSFMFLALLFSGIMGGITYSINENIPFVLSIFTSCLLLYKTVKIDLENIVITNTSINIEKYATNNISYMLYYGIARGIVLSIFIAYIPFLLVDYNVKSYSFALFLSTYTICGYISSRYYSKIKYSNIVKLVVSIIVIIVGLIVITFDSIEAVFFALLLFGFGAGLTRPITLEKIKKQSNIIMMERIYFVVSISVIIILFN